MKRIILSLMLGISSPNYAQISLNIGAETGTVDSGLPIPLVESYSKNGNSTVDDSNGDPYIANSLHYTANGDITAFDASQILQY